MLGQECQVDIFTFSKGRNMIILSSRTRLKQSKGRVGPLLPLSSKSIKQCALIVSVESIQLLAEEGLYMACFHGLVSPWTF